MRNRAGRRRLLAACAGMSMLAFGSLRTLARAGRAPQSAPGAGPDGVHPGSAGAPGPGASGVAPSPVSADPATHEPLYAVPTTLDRIGRVLAPVRVEGRGPFRFVVDTGASHSALSPALCARLGLLVGGGTPVRVHGVTGTEVRPTVRVRALEAGAIRLRDVELPVVEPQVFADADGILGVAGLRGHRLDIDFLADRVTIDRSRGEPAPPGFLVVPARQRRHGVLTVEARVGPVRGRAIVDTGAERTLGNLALQRRLSLAAQGIGATLRQTQVYGATNTVQPGESLMAPRIRIGDVALENLQVTFADLPVFRHWGLHDSPTLLIGMDLLGVAARLIVDYRRFELQLLQRTRR